MVAALKFITEEFGGRTRMSAPTPRLRLAESSSMPWLSPTSVRINVTGMAISSPLSRLGTKDLEHRPLRLLQSEFIVAESHVDIDLEQRDDHAVTVFGAVNVDDLREGYAVEDFPIAIARV